MNVLQIHGGTPLQGEVIVPGSKNASLAILSSVILGNGRTTLSNVPNVSDIEIKLQLLEKFGARTHWEADRLSIETDVVVDWEAHEEMVRPIRTSFYLLGPLLARVGRARLAAPGGCRIGARPVDFHIKGLQLLGARIELDNGYFVAETDGLKGAEIYLDFPSAGATQHLMATATMAEGVTVIQNAAIEPEVVCLAEFLNRMGARIEGAGTSTVTILGVSRLRGTDYRIPADRLQAGTYLLAGAITCGDVIVREIMPEHQTALINKLREAGLDATEGPDWVRVTYRNRMRGIRVKTMPYPGFPTDMQQPMAALLTLANGTSVVEETIYESRIGHIPELNRLGANIRLEGRSAYISGVPRLTGAVVEASDLRAGAALCMAGLAAEGTTTIKNLHFIDRGYERFEDILANLGANIQRIETRGSERRFASKNATER
jgi:UDP-N-acetylglucosamine 1-carboxyvinyltransferase